MTRPSFLNRLRTVFAVVVALVLCGEGSPLAPNTPLEGGTPTSPLRGMSSKASVTLSDEDALQQLKQLLISMRMSMPFELLVEADALRADRDGRRKQPHQAAPLLQAMADAANTSFVPRENSTEAEGKTRERPTSALPCLAWSCRADRMSTRSCLCRISCTYPPAKEGEGLQVAL